MHALLAALCISPAWSATAPSGTSRGDRTRPASAEETARLSDKHKDSILDATCRINVGEGSIRSGKTIASILKWLRYVHAGGYQ
ncbi:hypothetical protein GCM10029964_091780 [Kibdelosporangium lantanae]